MEFLNPALLWGLAGVSVPILIHLLNRFRYREVRWAAMDLLRKALVVRSRRVRIEDLILLALRCLAVLLVALALARPTVTPRGARWLASGSGTGAVIAIDASFSMGQRPGVRSRFEEAIDRAREAAATLAPGVPASLVLLGDRPRILLRNVGLDAMRLERALEGLEPLPEGLDLEAALEEIDGLAAEIRASGRECHLVTDGQALTWRDPSPRARETLRSIAEKARVFILPVGVDGDENLAVEALEHASGRPRVGAVGRFGVSVKNVGTRPREGVAVTLLLDGTPVDARTIDRIEPGAIAEAALFARFEREGSAAIAAAIEGDQLSADDARNLIVEVRSRTRVLCVDGDPAPGGAIPASFRGETAFLAAALRAGAGGADPAVAVETIAPAELAARDVTDLDVVVLANVPEVPPSAARMLLNFVRAGGGLIVFLGDAIEPDNANARFCSPDLDLLPGEILEATAAGGATSGGDGEDAAASPGRSIDPGSSEHPLARALRAVKPEILDEGRIRRHFRVRLVEGARPILALAGGGDTVLAERRLGRGAVLLFTTSADPSWHDLVANPAYPILIQEALKYLTQTGNERPLTVGDPIFIALPPDLEGDEVTVHDPSGTPFSVAVELSEGVRLARLPAAAVPGIYSVDDASSGGRRLQAAVNVNARESDIRALDPPALAAAVEGPGVRVIGVGEDLSAAVREGRKGRELWRALITAGLAVLAVESLLGRRFARRQAEGGVR